MKPHLITTADGEIVYDPPHVHHIIFRNDLEAWCCSTRGTPAGRIGPVTHISPGSGPALLIKTQKRQKALREAHIRDSKSAREKAGGIPTTGFLNQGAAATPISNRADETPSSQSAWETAEDIGGEENDSQRRQRCSQGGSFGRIPAPILGGEPSNARLYKRREADSGRDSRLLGVEPVPSSASNRADETPSSQSARGTVGSSDPRPVEAQAFDVGTDAGRNSGASAGLPNGPASNRADQTLSSPPMRADHHAATKESGSDAVMENGAVSPGPCPTEGGRVEGPGATLQSQTPSLQSMNGPSGKTATKSETVPTTPNDGFPPTHATADLVACGDAVMGAREVTTVNGRTCVLTTGDGTDYWGSRLLLEQLEKHPDLLPDIVVEAVSKSGRMYRTFSKAKGSPARTFGRLGGE